MGFIYNNKIKQKIKSLKYPLVYSKKPRADDTYHPYTLPKFYFAHFTLNYVSQTLTLHVDSQYGPFVRLLFN